MSVALILTQARRSECQQGTQPLAASRNDMTSQLRDQRNLGMHIVDDKLIYPGEIGRAKIAQMIKRGRRSGTLCVAQSGNYRHANLPYPPLPIPSVPPQSD
jgi:hypothetical protein